MGTSGRRIDLELNGLSRCQCQIHGSLPIMWHRENCESSPVRTKSKSSGGRGTRWLFCGGGLAVHQDPFKFYERCKTDSVEPKKCLAYVREWTDKERSQRNWRKPWVALSIRRAGTDG
jgi:hypothetical protein